MLTLIVFIASLVNMSFHGDLHERILLVSQEINEYPDSTLLYFKRGELYFQHEAYDSSSFDFKKCEELGNFTTTQFYFSYAKTLNMLEKEAEALVYLQKILDDDPYNVNTLRLMGKILQKKGEFCKAGILYENVITHTRTTFPYNYLEASKSYQKCNDKDSWKKSIDVIHSGLQVLGPLISFYQELIDISLKRKEYDQAIMYQTQVVDAAKRKEFPLYKRAKLYQLNNEHDLAEKDLIAAKKALDSLPTRIKSNKSTKELINNIDSLLSKY